MAGGAVRLWTSQIYFLAGAGVLALIAFLLVLSLGEGDEDGDEFKVGKLPEGTVRRTDESGAARGRNANAAVGAKREE
jgi:hypothetical protein